MCGTKDKKKGLMNFCPNCGTEVATEVVDGETIRRTICVNCHKDIQELTTNILQEKLFVKECTNCQTIGTIDAKYCFNCGAKDLVKKPILLRRTRRNITKTYEKRVINTDLRNLVFINLPMIIFTLIYIIITLIWKKTFPHGLSVFFVIVIILTLFIDVVYFTGLLFRTYKRVRKIRKRVRLEKFFEEKEK